MKGLGTLINLATVAAGGTLGVAAGHRVPERVRRTVMQGLGLVTIAVAVVGFEPLADPNEGLKRAVIAIVSVIAGGTLGELLRLEQRLEAAGERLRERLSVRDERGPGDPEGSSFVEGFVVASTVFCVGPLTVLGAVEDGLGLSIRLLAIKSTLDGFAAIGFASVYGWGVLGSLITIAVLQGGVTAAAVLVEPLLTGEVLAQLGAIGSLLVLGIGLRLLEVVRVNVVNLLPALVLGMIAAGVFERAV
ncbi:MAG: DUF554 domain-containing protein [Actinomycetota bacterium]|nr:DUF554 domain-containing protein [Actinomycetota bacterium]